MVSEVRAFLEALCIWLSCFHIDGPGRAALVDKTMLARQKMREIIEILASDNPGLRTNPDPDSVFHISTLMEEVFEGVERDFLGEAMIAVQAFSAVELSDEFAEDALDFLEELGRPTLVAVLRKHRVLIATVNRRTPWLQRDRLAMEKLLGGLVIALSNKIKKLSQ